MPTPAADTFFAAVVAVVAGPFGAAAKGASDGPLAAGLDGLVDFAVLDRWMNDQDLPPGRIGGIERLAGGTQNILVRFERGGRSYVLRRPPKHLRKASNEVLRRESKVLAALAGSDVTHPGLIAAETDTDVMGVVFYLMEPIDGFNPSVGLPEPYATDASWRHDLGLGVVDLLTDCARARDRPDLVRRA